MDWSRIPSLAALRAFEATARLQSFSKAARALNVTHAAIAHHVRSLEADLGETLVTRQGRGLAITPAGLQLADALSEGFSVIADGIGQIRAEGEKRPLNISVTPAFAANWLMPRIGEFWSRHPEIPLNISPSIDLADLRRDGIDLAIRYGEGGWPNLRSELLTDGDFWVVAHPRLLEGREVTCLGDVCDLPWVMESHMMERKAIVEREGIDFGTVQMALMNTNSLVLSATSAGLGVTVQPKSLVERQVETGELAKICELSQEALGYYLVTVPERETRRLMVFMSWLRAHASAA